MAIFGFEKLYSREPREINYEGRTIRSGRHWTLWVNSKLIASQLMSLGMIPKKSLTHGFPSEEQVPKHLLSHFVRGYFDGDGCLYAGNQKISSKGKYFSVSILSSEKFCNRLTEFVKTNLGVNFGKCKIKAKISGITMTGNPQVKVFMDWLYKDAVIFMERKHEKYKKLIEEVDRVALTRSSKYRNISYCAERKTWRAFARIDKKTLYLGGHYETEIEAYQAQQFYLESKGLKQDARITFQSGKVSM